MQEPPEHPEVWGQLGAEGVSQDRRDELRQKTERGDAIYFLILIPAGLFLIFGGAICILMGADYGFVRAVSIGSIVLGIFAWVAAAKILLGRR